MSAAYLFPLCFHSLVLLRYYKLLFLIILFECETGFGGHFWLILSFKCLEQIILESCEQFMLWLRQYIYSVLPFYTCSIAILALPAHPTWYDLLYVVLIWYLYCTCGLRSTIFSCLIVGLWGQKMILAYNYLLLFTITWLFYLS